MTPTPQTYICSPVIFFYYIRIQDLMMRWLILPPVIWKPAPPQLPLLSLSFLAVPLWSFIVPPLTLDLSVNFLLSVYFILFLSPCNEKA